MAILKNSPPGMTDAKEDDVLASNKFIRQQDSIIRKLWNFCAKYDSIV